MKKIYLAMAFLVTTTTAFAQFVGEKQVKKEEEKEGIPLGENWRFKNFVNFNFSQTALTNWNAGGENSFSVNGLLGVGLDYGKDRWEWSNYLEAAYGQMNQRSVKVKTDDRIEIASRLDYAYNDKKVWWISSFVNFRTQFVDGFKNPEDTQRISTFMAPAFVTAGLGTTYKPGDNFALYMSPATAKLTFVADDSLASIGAFGVEDGENFRFELGAYINARGTFQIMENVEYQGKLDLFMNYLVPREKGRPWELIDVNFENLILFKVNKLLTISLHMHLIYDDDVRFPVQVNGEELRRPRTQFKQTLGIGFAYKL